MFTLTQPGADDVSDYLKAQSREPFTYSDVGATQTTPPKGYIFDHHRVFLGEGRAVFDAACDAIRTWKMFPAKMCRLYWPDRGIQVGATVAVQMHAMALWSTNPARIVYALDDESDRIRRFGFAYGTLPGHVERGEERFLVEWHRTSGKVFYDLSAFSRPCHVLAWLGYPYVRLIQRRFRRLSGEAMQQAVSLNLVWRFGAPPTDY